MAEPHAGLAGRVPDQAVACGAIGSPLYAALLERVADDVLVGGPSAEIANVFLVTLRTWPGGKERAIGTAAPQACPPSGRLESSGTPLPPVN